MDRYLQMQRQCTGPSVLFSPVGPCSHSLLSLTFVTLSSPRLKPRRHW